MIDPTLPLVISEHPSEPKVDKLTPQQELFCQYYATDKEFFGNGVQSYIEAYGIDISKPGAYNSARSSAYENLIRPYILKRIDELLDMGGLNNQFVDKQLQWVILQNADVSSKVAAIREYNKLKQRIVEKVDVNAQVTQITIKREPVKKAS